MKIKIYLYSEQCKASGTVCLNGELIAAYERDEMCGDIFLWGEDTECGLAVQAVEAIRNSAKNVPGEFARKCAASVLEHLGAQGVEWELRHTRRPSPRDMRLDYHYEVKIKEWTLPSTALA